jgi:release factor glutamine methyltransferase
VGTDVSAEALDLANGNLNTVSPDTPVELCRGSFFDGVAVAASFDLVISNPPYVTETEFRSLEASVRDHEPHVALVSPDDGMFHIREICRGAAEVLRAHGLLLLEIDERRGVPAHEVAVEAGFDHVEILQDLFGRDRYLRASKGAVV